MDSIERLSSMLAMFEKNRATSTEDYTCFTRTRQPRMFTLARVKLRVARRRYASHCAQNRVERSHLVKPTVGSEHVLVQIDLQVPRLDTAVTDAERPRFQIRKHEAGYRQVGLGLVWAADVQMRIVPITNRIQILVARRSVRANQRSDRHIVHDERSKTLGAIAGITRRLQRMA